MIGSSGKPRQRLVLQWGKAAGVWVWGGGEAGKEWDGEGEAEKNMEGVRVQKKKRSYDRWAAAGGEKMTGI